MGYKFLGVKHFSRSGKVALGAWAIAITTVGAVGTAFAVPALVSWAHQPDANVRQLAHASNSAIVAVTRASRTVTKPGPHSDHVGAATSSSAQGLAPQVETSPSPDASPTVAPSPSLGTFPVPTPSATPSDDGDKQGVATAENGDGEDQGSSTSGSGDDHGTDSSGGSTQSTPTPPPQGGDD